MASVFGHAVAAAAIGAAFFPQSATPRVLAVAAVCAAFPDLDVLGFRFGIPYDSPCGHRGCTHSLVFALVFGTLVALVGFRKKQDRFKIAILLVLATASHPLLDMLTNGGRGCALWWPFSTERLFFPYRPIQVSPLGAGAFFSQWGLRVIGSELCWIGLPAICLVLAAKWLRTGLKSPF